MTTHPSEHQTALCAMAALLTQGRSLHISASLFAAAVGFYAIVSPSGLNIIVALIVLALFSIQTYFAIRVGLDAELFRTLSLCAAEGEPDWQRFDRGLSVAGLRAENAYPRDLQERLQGARRLFICQSVCLGVLVVSMAGLAASKWGFAA